MVKIGDLYNPTVLPFRRNIRVNIEDCTTKQRWAFECFSEDVEHLNRWQFDAGDSPIYFDPVKVRKEIHDKIDLILDKVFK